MIYFRSFFCCLIIFPQSFLFCQVNQYQPLNFSASHYAGMLMQEISHSDSNEVTDSVNTSSELNPLTRLGKDLLIQLKSPFHISNEQLYWVGAGVLTTTALLLTDQGTYNTVKDTQLDATWFSKASPVITEFGSSYGLGTLGLFASYSLITHNTKGKETAYLATEAFLTSSFWGVTIKWLTSRERPSVTSESGGEWTGPFGFLRKNKGQSVSSFDAFPSGHTWTAFSIATVFAEQYSDNTIVPILSYTAASLVGISRITEDAHWTSDVFVGAVLGYLTAQEVIANNPSEASRKKNTTRGVQIGWSLGQLNDQPVLQLHIRF